MAPEIILPSAITRQIYVHAQVLLSIRINYEQIMQEQQNPEQLRRTCN